MKNAFRKVPLLLSAMLVFGFGSLAQAGEAGPPVTARRALELAEKALADKGVSGEVYIVSLTLHRATVMATQSQWEALWSLPIEGSKPGSREVGVLITMSGDVIHLLKGRGGPYKAAPPH